MIVINPQLSLNPHTKKLLHYTWGPCCHGSLSVPLILANTKLSTQSALMVSLNSETSLPNCSELDGCHLPMTLGRFFSKSCNLCDPPSGLRLGILADKWQTSTELPTDRPSPFQFPLKWRNKGNGTVCLERFTHRAQKASTVNIADDANSFGNGHITCHKNIHQYSARNQSGRMLQCITQHIQQETLTPLHCLEINLHLVAQLSWMANDNDVSNKKVKWPDIRQFLSILPDLTILLLFPSLDLHTGTYEGINLQCCYIYTKYFYCWLL